MKLHDLTVGQRFTFTDKHRGKVFRVTHKARHTIGFRDVATEEQRYATSNRKTFRMDVELESNEKSFALNDDEIRMIISALHTAYLESSDENERSRINQLNLKLTGHPGRAADVPEGGPDFPAFPPDRKGDRS